MGHSCPVCYARCHCEGDIDDMDFGENPACTHCHTTTIECCICRAPMEVKRRNAAVLKGVAICDFCYDEKFGSDGGRPDDRS